MTEELDTEISLVMAVIRPERLSAAKKALSEVGAPDITITKVSGRGSEEVTTEQWRGEEYTVDLHEKVKIECVVNDVPVEDVVAAIEDAAHTGEAGDGKIFVLPVLEAAKIQTGKRGPEAI